MKIQNMFQKDINRDINGVIKVSQNDDNSLRQEDVYKRQVLGSLFAHTKNRLQYFYNIVLTEGKGVTRFHPRCAIDFFQGSKEMCIRASYTPALSLRRSICAG